MKRWGENQHSNPVDDQLSNIVNTSLAYMDGFLTLSFSRSRDTGDAQDWKFTDTDCYYFMYPIGGGPVQADTDIQKHEIIPHLSSQKICIRERKFYFLLHCT